MFVFWFVCVCVCVRAYVRACVRACMHACVCACVHVCEVQEFLYETWTVFLWITSPTVGGLSCTMLKCLRHILVLVHWIAIAMFCMAAGNFTSCVSICGFMCACLTRVIYSHSAHWKTCI